MKNKCNLNQCYDIKRIDFFRHWYTYNDITNVCKIACKIFKLKIQKMSFWYSVRQNLAKLQHAIQYNTDVMMQSHKINIQ